MDAHIKKVYVPVTEAAPVVQEVKMGWANFLGYFAMWAGAVINFCGGVSCITGAQYGGLAENDYSVFPALKGLNVVYGLICVAIAVFGVICALSIIKRRKSAIKFVPMMYGIIGCAVLIYAALGTAIMGVSCFASSTITNICVNVIMVFVNLTYFKNRAHIFVN